MSASDDATTLTCVGDDAPATRTKMLPSPLTDADGKLVPCSCRFSTACAQAGGRTASSCFWFLASTSVPAKFLIQKPDRIKDDVRDKMPGSKLHTATIQRRILPGELLMCSACEQKQRDGQKVHHAVPALATAWVHSSHCGVRTVRATGGGRGGVRQGRGGGSSSHSDEHGVS